ncbi:MAG: hypothetical protein RL349_563 [Bacteroidota bacterium]
MLSAIFLGIVQGLTEFLPISSNAHLAIIGKLMPSAEDPGAAFVAIGIFASALTHSQIVAFILAMFMCWVFYDGFELLGNFSQIGGLDYLIKYIGIAFHYEAIKKGVIDTSDILYFLSLNALFLVASLTVLKSLKK